MTELEQPLHKPSWGIREYSFSSKWFDLSVSRWQTMFAELDFAGRPGLNYLEIGVYEGASLCWMLENVLTDPSSTATVIDLIPDRPLLHSNLAASGAADRVKVLHGWSRTLLRTLPPASFDIVYVDGGHHSADVFLDLGLSWDLLKPSGLLMLDDYMWGRSQKDKWPIDVCPKPTIDLFLMAFANQLQVIRKDYQVCARKTERHPTFNFVRLGPFEYYWGAGLLVDIRNGDRPALTKEETALLTRFCQSLTLSSQPTDPANPVRREEAFTALVEKLGLGQLFSG